MPPATARPSLAKPEPAPPQALSSAPYPPPPNSSPQGISALPCASKQLAPSHSHSSLLPHAAKKSNTNRASPNKFAWTTLPVSQGLSSSASPAPVATPFSASRLSNPLKSPMSGISPVLGSSTAVPADTLERSLPKKPQATLFQPSAVNSASSPEHQSPALLPSCQVVHYAKTPSSSFADAPVFPQTAVPSSHSSSRVAHVAHGTSSLPPPHKQPRI